MNDEIRKIGIKRFVEMVFQTGTECLRERKEILMGEAHERAKMGLAPRILKQGEQFQVGPEVMKHAVQRVCSCGSKFFIPAVQVSTISALISPIGQELTAQQPVLICLKCQEPLNLKVEVLDSSDPPQGGPMI